MYIQIPSGSIVPCIKVLWSAAEILYADISVTALWQVLCLCATSSLSWLFGSSGKRQQSQREQNSRSRQLSQPVLWDLLQKEGGVWTHKCMCVCVFEGYRKMGRERHVLWNHLKCQTNKIQEEHYFSQNMIMQSLSILQTWKWI